VDPAWTPPPLCELKKFFSKLQVENNLYDSHSAKVKKNIVPKFIQRNSDLKIAEE
jgi:hypothetical protein